jgi:hypothetical protein
MGVLNDGEGARHADGLGEMGRLELGGNLHTPTGFPVLGRFMTRMCDIVIDGTLDIGVLVAWHLY